MPHSSPLTPHLRSLPPSGVSSENVVFGGDHKGERTVVKCQQMRAIMHTLICSTLTTISESGACHTLY